MHVMVYGVMVCVCLLLQALNNSHFAQLKDFIALQMPSGFPIKFGMHL